MPYQRTQVVGYFIFLAVIVALVLILLWPYLTLIALAAILAVLFYPLHVKILRKVKKENLAAILSVIIILIIILIPTITIGQVLFRELGDLYDKVHTGQLTLAGSPVLARFPAPIATALQNLTQNINSFLSHIADHAIDIFTFLFNGIGPILLSIILVLLSLFFLLRDADHIKEFALDISPLSSTHETVIFNRLTAAINGVVKGSFLVSLMQAIISTVGFYIFGLPQPILWGIFTLLAAFVPTFGTSLAFFPAAGLLMILGHTGSAIGLVLWWLFITVGLMDNVVSPRIIGSRAEIHPLLTLLSILGGVHFFGFFGFLFGPILMSILVTLLDIYRKDLKPGVTAA